MPPNLGNAFPGKSVDLYGESDLRDMLERNIAEGLQSAPDRDATTSHIGQIAAEIKLNEDQLSELPVGFRENLLRNHEVLQKIFEPLHLTIPTLHEIVQSRIDFARLAKAHKVMEELHLQPEIIVAPFVSKGEWGEVYGALRNNRYTNLRNQISDEGLCFIIDDQYTDGDTLMTHRAPGTHTFADRGIAWHASVIAGTPTAPVIDVDWEGKKDGKAYSQIIVYKGELRAGTGFFERTYGPADLLPTPSAYLTLQATKLLTTGKPLDVDREVWLTYKDQNGMEFTGNWSTQFPPDNEVVITATPGPQADIRLSIVG